VSRPATPSVETDWDIVHSGKTLTCGTDTLAGYGLKEKPKSHDARVSSRAYKAASANSKPNSVGLLIVIRCIVNTRLRIAHALVPMRTLASRSETGQRGRGWAIVARRHD